MRNNYSIDILRYAKKYKAVQLLGGKCEKCGEDRFFRLSFHHTSDDKEYNINELKGYRWEIIEKEIKKCNLLCRNCHSELHHLNTDDTDYKKNKKLYLKYKNMDSCEECGYNKCNESLTFHHRDDKKIKMSKCRNGKLNRIKESIIEELNKCKILCQNCHMEKHSNLDFFNENIDSIIEKSKNLKIISGKIDREIVKKMYFEKGMKQIEIMKYFNCAKGTISSIIKELKNEKIKD